MQNNSIFILSGLLLLSLPYCSQQKNKVNPAVENEISHDTRPAELNKEDSLIIKKLWTDYEFRNNTRYRYRSLEKAFAEPDSVINLAVYSRFNNYIPENIDTFINVQLIGMDRNKLKSLPQSIGNLKYLQIVHLNDNDFRKFPPELTKNRYLKTVLISKNNIEEVPDEIVNLIYLENLIMNDNNLGQVPDQIFELSNLKVLGLRNNKIYSLPDSIYKLENLERLNLQGNNISKLPDSITHLKNLKKLILKGNPLNYNYIDALRKEMPSTVIEF